MVKKLVIEAKYVGPLPKGISDVMSDEDLINYYSRGDGFELMCDSPLTILKVSIINE